MSWRLGLLLAWLPLLPAAVLGSTAVAADSQPHIATFATTVIAGGVTSSGTVGASGGLVTVDSASAYIRARLDSGPSSSVLADPLEPGALVRTLIGQTVGQQTLPVPAAEAQYPGQGSATNAVVPASAAGPLSVGAGSAGADAGPESATGQTSASTYSLSGVFEGSGSSSSAKLRRRGDNLSADSTSAVAGLTVAGLLTVANVSGSASITVSGGRRASAAGVTVGSASVGGVPVTIDGDGVHVASQTLVPLGPVQQTTEQVNQQLTAAGIAVHVLSAVQSVTPTGAVADSGGMVITVNSPPLPGGVAQNTLTIYIGRVVETESDSPQLPVAAEIFPPLAPPQTTTIVTSGDLGVPAATGAGSAPSITSNLLARTVTIAGQRLSAVEILLAFALWQLLSMGGPTLTTLVRRRRRERAQAAWT
jgi:hypothetical protein